MGRGREVWAGGKAPGRGTDRGPLLLFPRGWEEKVGTLGPHRILWARVSGPTSVGESDSNPDLSQIFEMPTKSFQTQLTYLHHSISRTHLAKLQFCIHCYVLCVG